MIHPKPSNIALQIENEQQFISYLDICAMYETEPSMLGFAQHLVESYGH